MESTAEIMQLTELLGEDGKRRPRERASEKDRRKNGACPRQASEAGAGQFGIRIRKLLPNRKGFQGRAVRRCGELLEQFQVGLPVSNPASTGFRFSTTRVVEIMHNNRRATE
jgi:hypothetical protein